jgi:hypothetical protein
MPHLLWNAYGRLYRPAQDLLQPLETALSCQSMCQSVCQSIGFGKTRDQLRCKGGEPLCRSAPDSDLDKPEGESKRRFVSGYEAGLRHCRDRRPKSKRESDQKTVKGSDQHSSPPKS